MGSRRSSCTGRTAGSRHRRSSRPSSSRSMRRNRCSRPSPSGRLRHCAGTSCCSCTQDGTGGRRPNMPALRRCSRRSTGRSRTPPGGSGVLRRGNLHSRCIRRNRARGRIAAASRIGWSRFCRKGRSRRTSSWCRSSPRRRERRTRRQRATLARQGETSSAATIQQSSRGKDPGGRTRIGSPVDAERPSIWSAE